MTQRKFGPDDDVIVDFEARRFLPRISSLDCHNNGNCQLTIRQPKGHINGG